MRSWAYIIVHPGLYLPFELLKERRGRSSAREVF